MRAFRIFDLVNVTHGPKTGRGTIEGILTNDVGATPQDPGFFVRFYTGDYAGGKDLVWPEEMTHIGGA